MRPGRAQIDLPSFFHPTESHSAGESALLSTFRDLVAQNFGDHGLGQALASLQGDILPKQQPILASSQHNRQGSALQSSTITPSLEFVSSAAPETKHGRYAQMQLDVFHLANYPFGALASLSFELQVWAALSMLTDLRNRTVMLHFLAITGELPARSLMDSSQFQENVHFSTFCAAGTVQNCKEAAQTFTSRAYPSLKIKEKVNLSFVAFAKSSSQCAGAKLDSNIPVTGGATC